MQRADAIKVERALNVLALALTDHHHVWTQEERSRYEEALRLLWNGKGTAIPAPGFAQVAQRVIAENREALRELGGA